MPDDLILVGDGTPTLGGSEYLAVTHGRNVGSPPTLDLASEAAVQRVVREAIGAGEVRTAHDISLGGLATAIAEMAIHSGIGVVLDIESIGRIDENWFGERSASILVAIEPQFTALVKSRADALGVASRIIGKVAGRQIIFGPGDVLDLNLAITRYESALLTSAT